jgi:hypothetical protein
MLLAEGTWKGARILSPASVARMTAVQLTPAQREGNELFLGACRSWGFGLAVPGSGSASEPFPCGIGWDGGAGTTWRSRAHDRTSGILFTQRQAISPVPPSLMLDFWSGVNAAVSTR